MRPQGLRDRTPLGTGRTPREYQNVSQLRTQLRERKRSSNRVRVDGQKIRTARVKKGSSRKCEYGGV